MDKWALYAIGQYCDQTVPDGFGGTEPRMTFNAYLAQQRKAWDVLSDFCSAMRCMPVWNGQTLTFVQDRPSDVVWPYTNSDVVVDDNGVGFRYSFSALKDRHTAVEVNYTDPQNGWQTSTELVEDPEAILRYGRNLLKMDAFGCTSRGQAHRAGLWVIKTELLETQTVDFTLGSQGLRHTPGDIIEICDNDYAGTMTGGRVLSIDAASRTLTLDREVTLPETGTATVNLINGSGKPASVAITAHPRLTGYRSAPCRMVWRHTVCGDSPCRHCVVACSAVSPSGKTRTARSPSRRCSTYRKKKPLWITGPALSRSQAA
ncbi:hypothetical protein ECZU17_43510 [Escherichia coli]|nr:hypothetical protein ECZU17_43510 [Escherichia coli]